ncbi:chorismate mutase [Candidatus Pantoea edessiphila]|uniref:Bifunctional chorismate mutase/prephenate dehydratase n=1 Tax=Candidatus Pantoea edessiphila TaxID=2044610 RepID=A0A2P5T1L1_9GAMM|nr:chorismate mutase [Candidatus Pantoea edessiphila]PPI88479.1 chorismate mutase [Candidatus Pantoea edessiphila]
MNYKNSALTMLRDKFNEIDEKILMLLSERRCLSIEIAKIKLKDNRPIRDIKRENLIIKKLIISAKKYELNSYYIKQLFKLVIEDSVFVQRQILQKDPNYTSNNIAKITFLGPKGSYSHIAARKYSDKYFDNIIELSCSKFNDIIKNVEKGIADYAILPLENTNSGSINEVYNLLQYTDLSITNEIILNINHCILSKKGVNLETIKTIYSHPEPFKQCSNFISLFPRWVIKYTESTAAAIGKVATINSINIAALGSEAGGGLYKLEVLKRNIANKQYNQTRFIVLSRRSEEISDHIPAKTTLIINTGQHMGKLVDILFILRKNNLVINRIESLLKNNNHLEKIFYIDIQGNLNLNNIKQALIDLKNITCSFKILGCYPSKNHISINNKY